MGTYAFVLGTIPCYADQQKRLLYAMSIETRVFFGLVVLSVGSFIICAAFYYSICYDVGKYAPLKVTDDITEYSDP